MSIRTSFSQCDGISLNLADGPALQGISLLNIPSTHGGTNMWGDSKARRMKKNSGGSGGSNSGSVKKQLKKKGIQVSISPNLNCFEDCCKKLDRF